MIQQDEGFLGFPFLFSSQASMKGNDSMRRRVFVGFLDKWFIYGFFFLFGYENGALGIFSDCCT